MDTSTWRSIHRWLHRAQGGLFAVESSKPPAHFQPDTHRWGFGKTFNVCLDHGVVTVVPRIPHPREGQTETFHRLQLASLHLLLGLLEKEVVELGVYRSAIKLGESGSTELAKAQLQFFSVLLVGEHHQKVIDKQNGWRSLKSVDAMRSLWDVLMGENKLGYPLVSSVQFHGHGLASLGRDTTYDVIMRIPRSLEAYESYTSLNNDRDYSPVCNVLFETNRRRSETNATVLQYKGLPVPIENQHVLILLTGLAAALST